MTIRLTPLLLGLALVLLPAACAEEEPSPPVAACDAVPTPEQCPCESTSDCWIDQCCLPYVGRSGARCVGYQAFAPEACLPR